MNNKLTGKQNYRILKRFGRKTLCVLQFEIEGFVPEYDGGGLISGETRKWWVDATPEMLFKLNAETTKSSDPD